jgi:hypothetical protein
MFPRGYIPSHFVPDHYIPGMASEVDSDLEGTYLQVADARVLAASLRALPGMARLLAQTNETLAALLQTATSDIDAAMRYQGRKYDPPPLGTQALEFPRVAYGPPANVNPFGVSVPLTPGAYWGALGGRVVIWDWDATSNMAKVPELVQLATLWQAVWLLAPEHAARLEAIQSGLAQQQIGTASETFSKPAELQAAGGFTGLSRRAQQIMDKFRLRSGAML